MLAFMGSFGWHRARLTSKKCLSSYSVIRGGCSCGIEVKLSDGSTDRTSPAGTPRSRSRNPTTIFPRLAPDRRSALTCDAKGAPR